VFTHPTDLPDEAVLDALRAGWGVAVSSLEYAPVGFGSHHWHVVEAGGGRWFVTVDDLRVKRRDPTEPLGVAERRLRAALSTARALRDAGHAFVVAPESRRDGDVVSVVDERWVVALYPFIEGRSRTWGRYADTAARHAVLDLLVELHAASGRSVEHALVDDFPVPQRGGLLDALDDTSTPWGTGPYGDRTRHLLARAGGELERAFARFDELVAAAVEEPERMVLTHGEPHAANTIETSSGVVLIDWDTALIAPPERDMWSLAAEDQAVLARYADVTGVTLRSEVIELYHIAWDLTEVALFVYDFRTEHDDTADTRTAWAALERCADALGGIR